MADEVKWEGGADMRRMMLKPSHPDRCLLRPPTLTSAY